MVIQFQEHDGKEQEEQGGWGDPQLPAPARSGAAFCGREQQGGWGDPQLPAPAPPGAAFAIPLERNGASGGWGPDVRNGALVQARAHLLKNHALACTRARFPHLMRSKSPRAVWGLGAGRAKWCSGAGEGASFQKSCSRLHQSMISTPHALKVAKGGLGPRGRACEVVLWCRRGRIF